MVKITKKLALLGGEKIRKRPFPPHPVLGKEEKKEVNDVLRSGLLSGFIAQVGDHFLGGPKVRQLEGHFKKYFSVKHSIAVNSATAGLHIAVASAGVGPGDEVIVSPYTMSASASAILMANAVPVFADIKADTYCIDPKSIKDKITSHTKAIMVVHLFGQAADMDEILQIAKKHKLVVIEDAAQSPGAIYKGKYVGTIGDVGIFSLNQHKTITTGEGGVVITNDGSIAEKAQLIRNHGEVVISDMNVKEIVNILGWNYRMTELEAAVGIAQFKKLDFLNDYRIELAEYLTDELKKSGFPGIELPVVYPWNKHVYFVYPMKFKEKEAGIKRGTFVNAVNAEGLSFGMGYVKPIYLEPMYKKSISYGNKGCPFKCPLYKGKTVYKKGICPVVERMYEKELMLTGICRYPLKKRDIKDVVLAFEKVFENKKGLKRLENKNKKK